MNTALRLRAELLLEQDRGTRAPAPAVQAQAYPLSGGVRGSTLYNLLTEVGSGVVSEVQAMRIGAVYASSLSSAGCCRHAVPPLPAHRRRPLPLRHRLWWLSTNPRPRMDNGWPGTLPCNPSCCAVMPFGRSIAPAPTARASWFEPSTRRHASHRVDGRNRYTFGAHQHRTVDSASRIKTTSCIFRASGTTACAPLPHICRPWQTASLPKPPMTTPRHFSRAAPGPTTPLLSRAK